MSDYLADDRPILGDEFTRLAGDPRTSVMVEACAGSGKTWLLVSRIVRILLDGGDPGSILAITFTRRAAQEMRARLLHDLRELAQADDAGIIRFLRQRGLSLSAAQAAIDPARKLYERVVTARVPLTIETFHGWFWRLLARAPLGSGVPFAPVLLESVDRLRADAWLQFTAALIRPQHSAERAAWEWLIDDIGEFSAKLLLQQFLDKRAEWWAFAYGDEEAAVARALAPLRAAGAEDPAIQVREPEFVAAVQTLGELWASITQPQLAIEQAADRARRWLVSHGAKPAGDFRDACLIALTKSELTPIVALRPDRISTRLATARQVTRYAEAHALVTDRLQHLLAARRTWRALKLNEAGLRCGRLFVESYQRLKEQQQSLDFTDLEWSIHRLLSDPDHAAYMQVRLDARYQHVLLDEFQDTNPLQWQILQSWLAAYGPRDDDSAEEGDRPRVFIVGDPKQSIYRFRRAEPRVFEAARDLLQRDYAATHLRTNVTRRNSQTVADVLNRAMPGRNPLYQVQSTLASGAGAFVLLPLAGVVPAAVSDEDASLRDVLNVPRTERDTDTRYREGRVFANELAHWVGQVRVAAGEHERPARWSDVLVLVRRRTHLVEYERALRDAGVPFVSDRRGGLLATLEADDLTALLGFLTSPFADLKLAHALRSPIFGCSDEDLMRLAIEPGASWWERLQGIAGPVSDTLARARRLLQWWLDLAGVLPVHDLLDRIYFEGDARRRYAEVAPAALHPQVQANLDAFIELALAVDAGRFPSLPRFIDELAALKQHAVDEAPDEGACEQGDAVRVMTIHGAKGLEAEIVVLADAHARLERDTESVLVAWPPQAAAPEHVSLVARGESAQDDARAHWFAQEDEQRVQEDWNLLYVAATRARQVLIVSGSRPAKGDHEDTWYTRLRSAEKLSAGTAPSQAIVATTEGRRVRDFLPEPEPTGERLAVAPDSDAMRLGRAWHAALELGSSMTVEEVARAHSLTPDQAREAHGAAARVRAALPHFFGGGSRSEVEFVSGTGDLLRVDRLIELDDVLWIVDFKWRVTEIERAPYEAQVRRYANVLRSIRADKPVRMGLITAAGLFEEVVD